MNNEITVTVTVREMDYIMNALALMPFREVNGFIAKLVNQANSQNVAVTNTAATGVVDPTPAEALAEVKAAGLDPSAIDAIIAQKVAAHLAAATVDPAAPAPAVLP